jgi:hypothetical protein
MAVSDYFNGGCVNYLDFRSIIADFKSLSIDPNSGLAGVMDHVQGNLGPTGMQTIASGNCCIGIIE